MNCYTLNVSEGLKSVLQEFILRVQVHRAKNTCEPPIEVYFLKFKLSLSLSIPLFCSLETCTAVAMLTLQLQLYSFVRISLS